jgi:hypothetical protein
MQPTQASLVDLATVEILLRSKEGLFCSHNHSWTFWWSHKRLQIHAGGNFLLGFCQQELQRLLHHCTGGGFLARALLLLAMLCAVVAHIEKHPT